VNEAVAREVLFVRAVETADASGGPLTRDDRGYAGRAAAELVRWQAADRGEKATAEAFVAKRAELLAARLAERVPASRRVVDALRWRPWIGVALPLAALAIGVVAEHVADRRHVNILAFPLLGLVVWNLAVYLWLLGRWAFDAPARAGRRPGGLRQFVAGARVSLAARARGPLAGAYAAFATDWMQRAAPLVVARAGRVLHVSAAFLALGAIAGLYVRGLAFEYRAGWESTFLDANAVHAILAFFLAPAAWVVGQPLPGVGEIAALRWDAGAGGENAGRWIVLYTVTVALAVVAPRLLLAAIAWRRERALSACFPVSLDEPYFRRVLGGWREAPARVRAVAYAYTPAQAATDGLQRLAAHLFGEDVRLWPERPVAFGEEDGLPAEAPAGAPAPDLVIALFNLASTPETENHGAFLDALRAQSTAALAVVVDESPYRRRLGTLEQAQARLAERRQAWSGLAATRGLRTVFADLEAPDLAAAERDLEACLSQGARPA